MDKVVSTYLLCGLIANLVIFILAIKEKVHPKEILDPGIALFTFLFWWLLPFIALWEWMETRHNADQIIKRVIEQNKTKPVPRKRKKK